MEIKENDSENIRIETTPDDWSEGGPGSSERTRGYSGMPKKKGFLQGFVLKQKAEHSNPKTHKEKKAAIIGGIILILIGIPMLVCPGPGIISIVTGISMVLAGTGLKVPKSDGNI